VVTDLSPDWRYARVELREQALNRNYVGTHFGGSLFAMTDPFYMLMLFHNLGPRYFVWDKTGAIDYVAPGRGTVHAEFRISEPLIEDIKQRAENGEAVRPEFDVVINDGKGAPVARVHKQLYVRLKPKHRKP
jgi:acyl-coenzyme A thioesterase PaaI-like protein